MTLNTLGFAICVSIDNYNAKPIIVFLCNDIHKGLRGNVAYHIRVKEV